LIDADACGLVEIMFGNLFTFGEQDCKDAAVPYLWISGELTEVGLEAVDEF
tara:strand:+ start:1063 stop:1215 length:153 start_codon:yes stop_codon:yes gene_type:complete